MGVIEMGRNASENPAGIETRHQMNYWRGSTSRNASENPAGIETSPHPRASCPAGSCRNASENPAGIETLRCSLRLAL